MAEPIMTKTELAVRQLVAAELGLDGAMSVPMSETLEEIGADSLDRMHLQLSLEHMLQIEIPWEEGEKMRTARDIVDYLEARYQVV